MEMGWSDDGLVHATHHPMLLRGTKVRGALCSRLPRRVPLSRLGISVTKIFPSPISPEVCGLDDRVDCFLLPDLRLSRRLLNA